MRESDETTIPVLDSLMNKHNLRKEVWFRIKIYIRGHFEQGHLSLVSTDSVLTMGNEIEKELPS
jgi:hypothetical protein